MKKFKFINVKTQEIREIFSSNGPDAAYTLLKSIKKTEYDNWKIKFN